MIELMMVLHLMTWDADTGELLEASQREIPALYFQSRLAHREMCRVEGVAIAEQVSIKWRANGYGNAFTNVNCWLEPRSI